MKEYYAARKKDEWCLYKLICNDYLDRLLSEQTQ